MSQGRIGRPRRRPTTEVVIPSSGPSSPSFDPYDSPDPLETSYSSVFSASSRRTKTMTGWQPRARRQHSHARLELKPEPSQRDRYFSRKNAATVISDSESGDQTPVPSGNDQGWEVLPPLARKNETSKTGARTARKRLSTTHLSSDELTRDWFSVKSVSSLYKRRTRASTKSTARLQSITDESFSETENVPPPHMRHNQRKHVIPASDYEDQSDQDIVESSNTKSASESDSNEDILSPSSRKRQGRLRKIAFDDDDTEGNSSVDFAPYSRPTFLSRRLAVSNDEVEQRNQKPKHDLTHTRTRIQQHRPSPITSRPDSDSENTEESSGSVRWCGRSSLRERAAFFTNLVSENARRSIGEESDDELAIAPSRREYTVRSRKRRLAVTEPETLDISEIEADTSEYDSPVQYQRRHRRSSRRRQSAPPAAQRKLGRSNRAGQSFASNVESSSESIEVSEIEKDAASAEDSPPPTRLGGRRGYRNSIGPSPFVAGGHQLRKRRHDENTWDQTRLRSRKPQNNTMTIEVIDYPSDEDYEDPESARKRRRTNRSQIANDKEGESDDKCPICYIEFTSVPVALPCGNGRHRFCLECFQQWNRDGTRDDGWLMCPICRAAHSPAIIRSALKVQSKKAAGQSEWTIEISDENEKTNENMSRDLIWYLSV